MRSLAVCLLLLSTVTAEVLLTCKNPKPPEFGRMTLKYFADGVLHVMFSCNEGLWLRGNKVATCIGDTWDHPTPQCVDMSGLKNTFRHILRPDMYAGDEPARESVSQESMPQESESPEYKLQGSEHQDVGQDRSQSKDESQKKGHHRGVASKKGRRTRERRRNGAKRRKASQEEQPLSNVPGATRLNETVVSQLDTSCTKKNPKKRSVKAPSIEHAHKPRYARSL